MGLDIVELLTEVEERFGQLYPEKYRFSPFESSAKRKTPEMA